MAFPSQTSNAHEFVETAMELGLPNLEIEKCRQKHESTRDTSSEASGLAYPDGIGETSESSGWANNAGTRLTCQVTRDRVASLTITYIHNLCAATITATYLLSIYDAPTPFYSYRHRYFPHAAAASQNTQSKIPHPRRRPPGVVQVSRTDIC